MESALGAHRGQEHDPCPRGSLRFGDKVVLGRDNVISTYLDIEIGDSVLMARLVLYLRFRPPDGRHHAAKDQGIINSGAGSDPTPGSAWCEEACCAAPIRTGAACSARAVVPWRNSRLFDRGQGARQVVRAASCAGGIGRAASLASRCLGRQPKRYKRWCSGDRSHQCEWLWAADS